MRQLNAGNVLKTPAANALPLRGAQAEGRPEDFVRRWLLGLIAMGLLAAGGGLMLWGTPSATEQYAAGCLRAGILLAVIWLAMPDTRPLKNRLALAAVLIASLVVVVRPRLLLLVFSPPVMIAIVVLAVLFAFLRPRRPRDHQRAR